MDFKNIMVSEQNNIVTITINRPEKLNALTFDAIQEIGSALKLFAQNYSIKGIIITGTGEKSFVAGADIAEFAKFSQEEAYRLSEAGHIVFNYIEQYHVPVIAACNGFALGAGCELAMACHIRLATPNAKFGQPEVNLGIIPGYGGTQRLVQLIGKGRATEMLLTADLIDAEKALAFGLVNAIYTYDDLLIKAAELIEKIATKGPHAIADIIKCVNAYYDKDLDGFKTEIEQFAFCTTRPEFTEGTTAFIEKRKANFR